MPITVFSMLFALAVHSFLPHMNKPAHPFLFLHTSILPHSDYPLQSLSALEASHLKPVNFCFFYKHNQQFLFPVICVKLNPRLILQYRSRNLCTIELNISFRPLSLKIFFIYQLLLYSLVVKAHSYILPFLDTHLWACQTHFVRTHVLMRCCRWL